MDLKRAVINTVKYAPLWIPGCLTGVTGAGVTGFGAFAERHAAEFAETRCICDETRDRMSFILDSETAEESSLDQYRAELKGARHMAKDRYKYDRHQYSYFYEAFHLLMSDAMPDRETSLSKEAEQRSRQVNRYLTLYNDVLERVPHLENEDDFEDVTNRIKDDFEDERKQVLDLLESQGRPDLIEAVELFESEGQVLKNVTDGWEENIDDLSLEFVIEQKELADISYEHFVTLFVLGENPLVDESVPRASSYGDLQRKYHKYIDPPESPSRVERGLLVMHYLTMLAQGWDDYYGQHADQRFGILNLPTYRQAQGFSQDKIYQETVNWADYYGCSALSLKASPRLFMIMGLGIEKGFPIMLDRYRKGSTKMQDQPTHWMRVQMAEKGYFDAE
ncbi:hypothetical protein HN748_00870 [Candidatus Peregrinibacteria bacterium]|mgnify:CR=1 FL=1|jgi:hypothetical protein|nr:hypothetical protein [Candidatus Peregrinibacteria bacterium]MBT7483383.1 hypothetical protein [Candidatus Peregrinibacteria bacterium]MBT7702763.1 hypothetical protein [Candidatus Peregrinibacteria bacterium]